MEMEGCLDNKTNEDDGSSFNFISTLVGEKVKIPVDSAATFSLTQFFVFFSPKTTTTTTRSKAHTQFLFSTLSLLPPRKKQA